MATLRFNLPKLATWVDRNEVVHLCFEWHSDFSDRTYWSTVCLEHDSLEAFAIDDAGLEHATCVRCVGGTAAP